MAPHRTYAKLLEELAEAEPLVAGALKSASEQRTARLGRYVSGMRLKGLEHLYAYLDAAADAYANAPDHEVLQLSKLAWLVRRVKDDFQTALEAALSGFHGVASDAMRDVMEIETLLLDFVTEPDHIEEWLSADRKTRLGKFGPARVRDRLRKAGVAPFSLAGFEAVDYRAHSEALHVSPPATGVVTSRGIMPSAAGDIFDDIPFIEMFEHANRVMFAIEVLRVGAGIISKDDGNYEPLTDRTEFDAAYERTQEMQVIVTTLLRAPKAVAEQLGRPGTAAEHMRYVADEMSRVMAERNAIEQEACEPN